MKHVAVAQLQIYTLTIIAHVLCSPQICPVTRQTDYGQHQCQWYHICIYF